MRYTGPMLGLTKGEERLLRRLTTPEKIQDFLDSLPMNWEKGGETHRSVRSALAAKTAQFEARGQPLELCDPLTAQPKRGGIGPQATARVRIAMN